MTQGEKLVWAAVYANRLDLKNPPKHVIMDDEKWAEWERGQVMAAVEYAGIAVRYLREVRSETKSGYGGDTWALYSEALK